MQPASPKLKETDFRMTIAGILAGPALMNTETRNDKKERHPQVALIENKAGARGTRRAPSRSNAHSASRETKRRQTPQFHGESQWIVDGLRYRGIRAFYFSFDSDESSHRRRAET